MAETEDLVKVVTLDGDSSIRGGRSEGDCNGRKGEGGGVIVGDGWVVWCGIGGKGHLWRRSKGVQEGGGGGMWIYLHLKW